MPNEKLEKIAKEEYVLEKKLTAAQHKEKRLKNELKLLTRNERTHRLCTRAGMLGTFLREPTLLTDDDVMELLTFIFSTESVQNKLNAMIKKRQEEWAAVRCPRALYACFRQLPLFENKSIFTIEQIITRLSALFYLSPNQERRFEKCLIPHFNISIIQRSRGQSAIAGAAYQSGDRLFSDYDQKYKDYSRKQGIVYTEIMLPPNAPHEFADRETLWNAAEEIEKQWNSQLARRFVLILPLAAINKELQPMKDIRRWVGKVISPERSEIENKPKQKHSITEKMQYYQDKEKVKTQEMAKTMEQEELS